MYNYAGGLGICHSKLQGRQQQWCGGNTRKLGIDIFFRLFFLKGLIFHKKYVKNFYSMKVRPQGAGCRENRFFWQLFYYRQYSRFVIAWATIFCFYCPASFSLHLAFFHLPGNFSVLTNSSDVFIKFVTPICSMNCSQFEQLKKKTNFWLVQYSLFSQFAS